MSKLGLNVGSGQRRFTTTPEIMWLNIDSVSRPGHEPDLVCDGAAIPRADASADYFVLHHVCEHFQCGEAVGLIQEAYRVLAPGGSLIVCVPDMRMLAARWLNRQIDTQLYMTNIYGAYMGNDADTHKWGFDRDSLASFLRKCNWYKVQMFDYRSIPGADLAKDWWIAALECIR